MDKLLFTTKEGIEIKKNNKNGLVYTSNFKSPNYSKYHRDETYNEEKKHFNNIFSKRFFLIKKFKKNGRILDIGSSTGNLLEIFLDDQWECWGVEPSESYKLQNKKIHAINMNFEKAKLNENYFDVVIMNHTLEHVANPDLVIKKIYKILKKDGIIFIDVPNFGSLSSIILKENWPFLLPHEHSYHFTKKSLSSLLKSHDFKIIYSETRSGIFDMQYPLKEIFESFIGLKKRFFTNLIFAPQSFITTKIGMGTALTIIAKK